MLTNKYSLTKEALERLKLELDDLKIKRKEAIERIKVAKGYGDLSENSEYSEARETQGLIESRVSELEEIIRNARVIQVSNHTTKIVILGSMIDLEPVNSKEGSLRTWQLVTSVEANPTEGKISQDSPVGKVLGNKQTGDLITIKTPKKDIQYKIVKIY